MEKIANISTRSEKEKSKKYWVIVFLVVLTVILGFALRLSFTYYSLKHLPPVSDEAAIALQAMEIHDGKRPLFVYGLSYLFPIDSYTMAPFINSLPRNSLGVRYQNLLLGYMSIAFFLVMGMRIFSKGRRWPLVLLLLLPSSYWTLFQSAYCPPQYALTIVTLCIYLLIAIQTTRVERVSPFLIFFSGIVGGLTLSFQPVFVSAVCAGGLAIVWSRRIVDSLKRTGIIFLGALVGLSPFLAAKATSENAFSTVTQLYSIGESLGRLRHTIIDFTLPKALGADPPIFFDFPAYLNLGENITRFFLFLFLFVFVAVLICRVIQILFSENRDEKRYSSIDIFIVTTVFALVLFALNKRAIKIHVRYLLPVVWSFPFLFTYLINSIRPRFIRSLLVVLLLVNLGMNAYITNRVLSKWRKPEYIAQVAETWNLDSLIHRMEELNITRCHASFWLAYRITHQTNKEIICTPPSNELLPGWKVPDKEMINSSQDVAYVMTDSLTTRKTARRFRHQLGVNGISAHEEKHSNFFIFRNFKEETKNTLRFSNKEITYSNPSTKGRGVLLQEPVDVDSMVIFFTDLNVNYSRGVHVSVLSSGKWQPVVVAPERDLELFEFRNNHPIYGALPVQVNVKKNGVEGVLITSDDADSLSDISLGITIRDHASTN